MRLSNIRLVFCFALLSAVVSVAARAGTMSDYDLSDSGGVDDNGYGKQPPNTTLWSGMRITFTNAQFSDVGSGFQLNGFLLTYTPDMDGPPNPFTRQLNQCTGFANPAPGAPSPLTEIVCQSDQPFILSGTSYNLTGLSGNKGKLERIVKTDNLGNQASMSFELFGVTSVPEPGTGALALLGGALWRLVRLRRKGLRPRS